MVEPVLRASGFRDVTDFGKLSVWRNSATVTVGFAGFPGRTAGMPIRPFGIPRRRRKERHRIIPVNLWGDLFCKI